MLQRFILGCLCLAIGQQIIAQEATPASEWDSVAIFTDIVATPQINTFCRQFGAKLTTRFPLGGLGPWKSFACKAPAESTGWSIKFGFNEEDQLILQGYRRGEKTPRFTVEGSTYLGGVLTKSQMATLTTFLAMRVSEKLPVGFRIRPRNIKESGERASVQLRLVLDRALPKIARSQFMELFVPKKLTLYTLKPSGSGLFVPRLLATGDLSAAEEGPTQTRDSTKKAKTQSKTPNLSWNLTTEVALKSVQEVIFAHSATGPKPGPEEESWLEQSLPGLEESIQREKFNRIQLGLRFGKALAKEPALLRKATLLGLLLESKRGWSRGLKAYYDYTPKVKGEDESGNIASLYSSRFVVGWSLGLPITQYTWGIFDTVDVTPKVGMWSFEADLPVADDSGNTTIFPFVASRAFSAGWELGVETQWSMAQLRLWYGGDFAGLFAKRLGGTQVSMHRYGADLMIRGFSWGAGPQASSINFLLFVYAESVSLSDTKVDLENPDDAGQIRELEYATGFAGAGFTIAL